MPETTRFVSVTRFAELVGLSERTCWNLIRARQIPVYRVGRRTLVKPEEGVRGLERIATSRRRDPEATEDENSSEASER